MRLLLDTHAFVWWTSSPEALSPTALKACQNEGHELVLSVVSVWEMQIKLQLDKLRLTRPLADVIATQRRVNRLEILPVSRDHVLELDRLPLHHRDPFDRLLVSQARFERMTLLSQDSALRQYEANVLW